MAKFCGKCGSQLDELTGLCPMCDINEKTVSLYGNANDTSFDFDKTMASDNVYSAPADTQFLGYENTQQSFVPEVPVVKEEIKNIFLISSLTTGTSGTKLCCVFS